ncbi:Peptidyl-prolyl cis-trans isomerase D [Jannaschia donghaensis]|uniref:Parvulin-like PPIase n=2 Tax=Jannaschia donghaensis TaxID=420998 RepID=A0A0M6YME2_9RHOB|nr:Peptidyl-prolyl cis-trans isomerase D [Jannaschia donghaensis]
MAETKRRKKKSNMAVWVVLGLLILALGGFGVGGFGSSLSTVASVGDRDITVQEYADALQAEQARVGQQFGQRLTIQQMQALGLDRRVMERLLAGAALEEEADRVGLSIGDGEVARRIRENPAFGGIAGGFDREGYAFALDRAGLSERAYEEQIRNDIARELLQAAVVGGTEAPATYVDTLTRYVAETRDVTLTPVTVADLAGGQIAPTEDDLQTFYDENQALFETPELRAITYAWVAPDRIVDGIEVDEVQLREVYEDRIDQYRQPARVLAERLAFADTAAAEAALAAIESGEMTFDALVEDRGLTLDDVDQGEIAQSDVDADVADALFALEEPGIAGPVETSLGPALFRVNAILNPTEITFEEVRDSLVAEVGLDTARRSIDADREMMDDMLAGGATLEELAADTMLTLGTVRWDAGGDDQGADIAAYDEFRAVARAAQSGDFPELETLSDGGLFALRLDEIVPPTVPPLSQLRGEVEAAWRAQTQSRQLTERAAALAASDTDVPAAPSEEIIGLARDATLEGTPRTLVSEIFAAEDGVRIAIEGDDQRAYIVSIDAVNVPDLTAGEAEDIRAAVEQQAGQTIASDVFEGYGQAIQDSAGFTVDQQSVQAIQAQLGGTYGG